MVWGFLLASYGTIVGSVDVLSFLFPKYCVSCKKLGSYLCGNCQKRIVPASAICPVCEEPAINGQTHPHCRTRHALDGLVVACEFSGPARDLVHTFKYRFVSDVGLYVSQLMNEALAQNRILPHLDKPGLAVPIPLHWKRRFWRGFNQARYLSARVSKHRGWQMDDTVLKRSKETAQQAKLPFVLRRRNLKRAFIAKPERIAGKNIILVDDVWTSGSTMRSAAAVLKQAGALSVWGLVFAR